MYTDDIRKTIENKYIMGIIITSISTVISFILWVCIWLHIMGNAFISFGYFTLFIFIGGIAILSTVANVLTALAKFNIGCEPIVSSVISIVIWLVYFILYLFLGVKPENIVSIVFGSIISIIICIVMQIICSWYIWGIATLNTLFHESKSFDDIVDSLINVSSEYNQEVEEYNCLLNSINNLCNDYKVKHIEQFTLKIQKPEYCTDDISIFNFGGAESIAKLLSKNISILSDFILDMEQQIPLLRKIGEIKLPILSLAFEVKSITKSFVPNNIKDLLKYYSKTESEIYHSLLKKSKNVFSIFKKDNDEKYKIKVKATLEIYRQAIEHLDMNDAVSVQKFIDMVKIH